MSKFLDIGKSLAEHSTQAEFTARGAVDDLFPFIYVASKRMSVRAISKWLEEQHNVKISHVSISKALNNADEHFQKITDKVFETALILEEEITYDAAPFNSMFQFLFSEKAFEEACHKTMNFRLADTSAGFEFSLFDTIRANWFTLPVEVRDKCEPFLIKKYHNMQKESQNEANIPE